MGRSTSLSARGMSFEAILTSWCLTDHDDVDAVSGEVSTHALGVLMDVV
jgi:hypothetical protein